MDKVYWFKLPTVIKEKVEVLKATQTCLDNNAAIDAAVAEITWFNLPKKVEALIAVINTVFTTPYDKETVTWFKLDKDIEAYFEYLETAVCAA